MTLEIDRAKRRLVIPVTTVDDTGEYICDTEDDSVTFLVTITGKNNSLLLSLIALSRLPLVHGFIFTSEPPLKLTCPQNMPEKLETLEGKPIVLEIEVSRANAEVKWRLGGREVQESANVTVTKDGLLRRLTIRSPAPEDSGKYTCNAADDSIDFQVQVSGKWFPSLNAVFVNPVVSSAKCNSAPPAPPVKILRRSEIKRNVRSLVSDEVVLECELSRANGVAKWYKDNCRVEGDERYCEEEEGTFRSLVILNAELGDSGEYFLDVGDDSISFQVTVEGRFD